MRITPIPSNRPVATRSLRARRLRRSFIGAIVLLVLVSGAGLGAVAANLFGVGERFEGLVERVELIIDPPPDRPIEDAVKYTAPSSIAPTPLPSTSLLAVGSARPSPSAPPLPVRVPVDVSILAARGINPESVFNSQVDKDWCSPAGVQMALAVLGLADNSDDFQRTIASRIGEWESWRDSHNGNWGPSSMVDALAAYGADSYELRAYERRPDALRDAAVAISKTGAPVILLAWRGAHTWVMTGYRADAEPVLFLDAEVTGAYVLDPWYPRVSSIWGPSDGPGVFQDTKEMERNFLPWKRPEGRYPARDGLFIALVPIAPMGDALPIEAGS